MNLYLRLGEAQGLEMEKGKAFFWPEQYLRLQAKMHYLNMHVVFVLTWISFYSCFCCPPLAHSLSLFPSLCFSFPFSLSRILSLSPSHAPTRFFTFASVPQTDLSPKTILFPVIITVGLYFPSSPAYALTLDLYRVAKVTTC